MRAKHALASAALFTAALVASPIGRVSAAAQEAPRGVIEQFNGQLEDVMKHASALGFQGRSEKLQPAVRNAYDLPSMAKESLGAAGAKLSAEDLTRLSDAYARYSAAVYADQFTAYSGEKFTVGETRKTTDTRVVVPSQIVPAHGDPVEIDYVLQENNGHWGIVDVLFDGTVSQLAVRRSEFAPIFRREGLPGLIAILDGKSAQLANKQ
jgi:phospholipid transport system substrate-binding protein